MEQYYNIEETFFTNPLEFINNEKGHTKGDIFLYPDNYTLEANICRQEVMDVVDADTFIWAIDEERFDEDRTQEDKLREIFNKYIDFDAINKEMPKLWYPTNKIKVWTKQDLLNL